MVRLLLGELVGPEQNSPVGRSRAATQLRLRGWSSEGRGTFLAEVQASPGRCSDSEVSTCCLGRNGRARRRPRSRFWRQASLALSAGRLAISECRCPTLAGGGLLSVPAPERNQGSGLSGRGDGLPEGADGLAAGDERVAVVCWGESCFRCHASEGVGMAGSGSDLHSSRRSKLAIAALRTMRNQQATHSRYAQDGAPWA